MRRLAICGWLALWASAGAEAQLRVPRIGWARFGDGSVRVVKGVPANLIVDAAGVGTAERISFSDAGGLTAEHGLIRLLGADGAEEGEYDSGEAQPLLNLEATLGSAAVWLPSKHMLLTWDGAKFIATAVDDASFGGTVTFVRLASAATAEFYAMRADSSVAKLLVALPAGQLVSAEAAPGVSGAVFMQNGRLVSQDEYGLLAVASDGGRWTIRLSQDALPAGDLTVERMSNDWLHVTSRSLGRSWAVYLSEAHWTVSLIPPPAGAAGK